MDYSNSTTVVDTGISGWHGNPEPKLSPHQAWPPYFGAEVEGLELRDDHGTRGEIAATDDDIDLCLLHGLQRDVGRVAF